MTRNLMSSLATALWFIAGLMFGLLFVLLLCVLLPGCALLDQIVSDVNTVGSIADTVASSPAVPIDVRLAAEIVAGVCAAVAGCYVMGRRLAHKHSPQSSDSPTNDAGNQP